MFYINQDKNSFNLNKDEILHISKGPLDIKSVPVRVVYKSIDFEGGLDYIDIDVFNTLGEANDFIGWLSMELEFDKATLRTYNDFIEFNKSVGRYRVI